MRLVSAIFALAVSLAIALSLSAAEKKDGDRKHADRPVFRVLEKVKRLGNLSEDQKAKLDALEKEYLPKIKAAHEKADFDKILTEEQKKARDEAKKTAKAAGKKGKDARKAVEEAVKLTDAQKAKLADARKEVESLRDEFNTKIKALLTNEQKEQLKKPAKEEKKRRDDGSAGK